MQSMDIDELLKSPEGKTLEFKQDLSSPQGVLRTMVAFANMGGGTIVIGIKDKTNHVVGLEEPLILEEKLANLVSDLIEPQLLPEIEIIPWRNTYLVTVQVFPSSSRPHYLKKQGLEKGTYIRVGSTDRNVDKIMLSELQRVRIEDSYDKQAMSALSVEDIDFSIASEFFSGTRNLNIKDLESLDLITTV
ncbi:MAG: helix-turn-helix domain-containing protein [Gammaproteobacteria bacterium]